MNKIYDAILGRVFITFFLNQVESIYSSLKRIILRITSGSKTVNLRAQNMIKHYVESPSVTICRQNRALSQNTDLEVEKSLKVA